MASRTYNLFMAARQAAIAKRTSEDQLKRIPLADDAIVAANAAPYAGLQIKALKADALDDSRKALRMG